MADIFLSYAREDAEFANRVVQALSATRMKVWWDQQMPAGVDWAVHIEKRIQQVKCVVVLWSKASKESKMVREEARFAQDLNKLVQVGIDGTLPPFGWRTDHAHDLSRWRGEDHTGWALTLEAIQLLVGGSGSLDSLTQYSKPLKQRVSIKPGQRFRDRDFSPTMVAIGSPRFDMGDFNNTGPANEKPVRQVHISKPFAMGVRPVMFEEWETAISRGARLSLPDDKGWGRQQRPVINVSWKEAREYIAWLCTATGESYRLPTEAEWEYCARSNSRHDFAFGKSIDSSEANIDGVLGKTSRVGSYSGNSLGLYDMHGNVWEWVEDCWHDTYMGAPADGSAWTSPDTGRRVLRGGSWRYGANEARASYRAADLPDQKSSNYGFRVARNI